MNLIAKPVLIILTLPINIITLGLFTFILNAIILWFVGYAVTGFRVAGFFPALLGAIVISVLSIVPTGSSDSCPSYFLTESGLLV